MGWIRRIFQQSFLIGAVMAKIEVNAIESKERARQARLWREFRKKYLFTQVRLADTLGISRRTVQQIEACDITPHPGTLRKFNFLKRKHEESHRRKQKVWN